MPLMRSSERVAGRSWATSVPAVILTTLIAGSLGAGALWGAWDSAENRVFNVLLGLFMLSVSLVMLSGLRRSRARWSATTLDGRPGWRLAIGDPVQLPAVALVACTIGVGFVAMALSVRNAGGWIVFGPFAAFMLAVGAEMLRIWIRRPHFTVTADRLLYRGPGIDVELGWNDVEAIAFGDLGSPRGALQVAAMRDATSYRYELHRLVFPTDRAPEPAGIEIRTSLLPDVVGLKSLLQTMRVGGPSVREALISRGLPEESGY